MASPTNTAPQSIPPLAFGPSLEDAPTAGATFVLDTEKLDANIGAAVDVKSVVGANPDIYAAVIEVDRGIE